MAKFEITISTPRAGSPAGDAQKVHEAVLTALNALVSSAGSQTGGAIWGPPVEFGGERLHLGNWKFTPSLER